MPGTLKGCQNPMPEALSGIPAGCRCQRPVTGGVVALRAPQPPANGWQPFGLTQAASHAVFHSTGNSGEPGLGSQGAASGFYQVICLTHVVVYGIHPVILRFHLVVWLIWWLGE